MHVSVVIPTVEGREAYLARCLEGYMNNTTIGFEPIVMRDRETCGLAWREGAEKATGHYLHLTADDIVPGPGWDEPFIEAVDRGHVPCGLVIAPISTTLDERAMPIQGAEWAQANFFEAVGGEERYPDWYPASGPSEYPSIPFCSREQWEHIQPMIAAHYGTDRWFGHRAALAGYEPVVRHGAHFYHYAAHPGRVPRYSGWLHTDLLDFELNLAYPKYVSGELDPGELDPLRGTAEGRVVSRAWRSAALPGPHPWEIADLEPIYR